VTAHRSGSAITPGDTLSAALGGSPDERGSATPRARAARGVYWEVGEQFASHRTVVHSIGEYVRGDAHTNTIEGYFSIFKRGIYGVYHHVSQQHLKRYLGEFDFRYNERIALGVTDAQRASKAIKGAAGKRLTYRPAGGAEQASA
jgi:hypothetical protein